MGRTPTSVRDLWSSPRSGQVFRKRERVGYLTVGGGVVRPVSGNSRGVGPDREASERRAHRHSGGRVGGSDRHPYRLAVVDTRDELTQDEGT